MKKARAPGASVRQGVHLMVPALDQAATLGALAVFCEVVLRRFCLT
jgi:hypothetical protein